MYNRKKRSDYALIFFMLFSFSISLSLGTWQVHRYQYKKIAIKNHQESIITPTSFIRHKCDATEDYKVFSLDRVSSIVNHPIYYFVGLNQVKVIYPANIHDKHYFIDFGVISNDKIGMLEYSELNGSMKVYSKLKKSEIGFIKNDYNTKFIYSFNWDKLTAIVDLKIEPCVLYVIEHEKEFTDLKFNDMPEIRNIHGIYIFFWYAIAFFSLIFLILFVKKR